MWQSQGGERSVKLIPFIWQFLLPFYLHFIYLFITLFVLQTTHGVAEAAPDPIGQPHVTRNINSYIVIVTYILYTLITSRALFDTVNYAMLTKKKIKQSVFSP